MFFLTALSVLLGAASCAPTQTPHYTLKTVHQFPNNTWIENMAVRSNGQILATDYSGSQIFLVDPVQPQSPRSPPVIARFPNRTCVTGIAEVEPDVFYTQSVLGDAYNLTYQPNTTVVWRVDMRPYARSGHAAVTKVADVPGIITPNGMCLLSQRDGTILIADSEGGVVWRFNVHTREARVVVDDPTLAPIATDSPPFGVNGVHIANETLFYSNTNRGYLGKVPIHADGTPAGKATIIARNLQGADDFDIDDYGNVWLTVNAQNELVRVSPAGDVQVIAGGLNSTALSEPVRAVFGRGPDRGTLFVSTDGLEYSSTGELVSTAGKIASLKIFGY